MTESASPKKRGFACMPKDQVQRIASMGGKRAHEVGTAHEFTKEEARECGRKGGLVTGARRRQAVKDRQPNLFPEQLGPSDKE